MLTGEYSARCGSAVTETCIVHKDRFPVAGIILGRVIRVFLSDAQKAQSTPSGVKC